jgi:hypothetical protein
MKTIKYMGVMFFAILLSARVMAQETKDQQLVVALSDAGKPYKLNVGLVFGSIKVTGYSGKDIIIDVATDDHKKDLPESSLGMKRIGGGEDIDVTAHEKNNEVTVNSGGPRRPINLVIKVPQVANSIKLSTVNNGGIVVSDVSGDLEIQNTNGYINLFNISGSVVANTVNGKVLVTFKSIDPKAAMAFSTLNGNVDVTFPAGFKGNMKVRSDRGQVYSDFEIAPDPSQPKATKTVKDGMYHLSIEDWIYGKIGGGGPEILMKNMSGNIYIRKAK